MNRFFQNLAPAFDSTSKKGASKKGMVLFVLAALWSCTPEPAPEAEDPCAYKAPQIAATPATSDFAMHPGRCGIADYQWSRSSDLGKILETRTVIDYEASVLELAAIAANVDLPRPPRYDVRLEQIRYQTQDRGQLIDATGVVAYPINANPGHPFDVTLILHGTSGFTDGCGPSSDDDSRSLAALFASLGMIVAAPDYIGLKNFGEPTGFIHPYLIGEATAMASLDIARSAVRAANAYSDDMCVRSRLAFFGGSQGGHAALWVDRLAPYYAQEFELLGGVTTVPPADLMAEAQRALTQTVPASGNSAVMLAAGANWYGYEDRMDEIFMPNLEPTVSDAMAASCDPSDAVDGLTIDDVFAPALLDAAGRDQLASYAPWACMIEANSLLDTDINRLVAAKPSYGILYILGENDDLVHTPIERSSFDSLCERGMPLQYLECAGASHVHATTWAYPEILNFLDARLADEPMDRAKLCQRGEPVRCTATPED